MKQIHQFVRIDRRTTLLSVMLISVVIEEAKGASLLGVADDFAVLGATTITDAGTSAIFGDVGLVPGSSITGLTPAMVTGTIRINDQAAIEAKAAALVAYNSLAGMTTTQSLTGELGGLTLTPGVYTLASSATLTGTLTLDGTGISDPMFVFQIGSTLTTFTSSLVALLNGASGDNIYFQVGSSATLGTNSQFAGTILANQSVTLATGASIADGAVFALNGAVSLDGNTIRVVPEPGAVILLATGAFPLLAIRRRKRPKTAVAA
jgi:hypothetical protein